jgi:hypothetical protein
VLPVVLCSGNRDSAKVVILPRQICARKTSYCTHACGPADHPYCDDIVKTVAELKARGVEFTGEIEDRGYGHVIGFKMPGNVEVDLYQPRYTRNATAG